MSEQILCIACGVFRTDLDMILKSGKYEIETLYIEGGLHSEPLRLRQELQNAVTEAGNRYKRIIILYGLCGKGIVGIHSETTALVIPRVHDCISLFLGGPEVYRKQFAHSPGTYYISAGWYEEQVQPKGGNKAVKYSEAIMGSDNPESLARRFGKENADTVTDFLDSWRQNYSRCVYVETGASGASEYETYTRNLAKENNWRFEKISGSQNLIVRCLQAEASEEDILLVPPEYRVYHDTTTGTINAAPPGETGLSKETQNYVVKGESTRGRKRRRGLGIDAGGTYTDAVVYDFETGEILSKAKALTTKWRYSIGIMEAVSLLPPDHRENIDIVSVSTTLVTNAVVESNRRPVGLLLMPNGSDMPPGLPQVPVEIIRGRMTICGEITQDIDNEEILDAVRTMKDRFHVEAIAVSGYAGAVNPELELKAKNLIRRETDLEVCCGHELSGQLNFSVRATTAILNAGVIPIMEEFLDEMDEALEAAGFSCPMLVVRGDGTVMSRSYARDFPVQAALSGPAASMAGAKHLTGLQDATVVDVGGTTSDIGFLSGGTVSVRREGAVIGEWNTHVAAVDMLTIGIGGDSEILFQRQEWTAGPRRITPVSWLSTIEGLKKPVLSMIAQSEEVFETWKDSTVPLQILHRTGKIPDYPMSYREQLIWDSLENGPLMIWQIAEKTELVSWRLIQTQRLESSYCLRRCGLTPTDIFIDQDRLDLWDRETASAYLGMISKISDLKKSALNEILELKISRKLGTGFLRKLFGPEIAGTPGENAILQHGNEKMTLRPRLKTALVGLGAPASLIAENAARILGAELVLCENGDVANAVGAITSRVTVERKARIAPTSEGGFRIEGLIGETRHFETLEEAGKHCIAALADFLRTLAKKAGTGSEDMELRIETETSKTSEGSELFIEQNYMGRISGIPDMI